MCVTCKENRAEFQFSFIQTYISVLYSREFGPLMPFEIINRFGIISNRFFFLFLFFPDLPVFTFFFLFGHIFFLFEFLDSTPARAAG